MTGPVSVIVRTKNEVATLERAVSSLRRQTVDVEVVVVDSGSTDGTLELARRLADTLVELPPERFTYGRSLNLGAAAAAGSILFALSAHCVASSDEWVERSLAYYAAEDVAGTTGDPIGPDGGLLTGSRTVTPADVLANPHWGLSNHASSWRRQVWEEVPFDESAESCEDKLWMWTLMRSGWVFVVDPALVVDSSHRRASGLRSLWRREYREHRFIAGHLDYPLPSTRGYVHAWLRHMPLPSSYPDWARPLGPHRMVEHLAGYLGDQAGVRRRGAHTFSFTADPMPARAPADER